MRGVKTLLAILQGRAIVLIKRDEHKARNGDNGDNESS